MSKLLDRIAAWSATGGGPNGIGNAIKGRADLGRVGVMGHSRGGEGVDLFAAYNAARPATAIEAAAWKLPYETETLRAPVPDFGPRYPLKAVFSLAPVDGQGGFRPEFSGTAFATALPYCDGDVFNLQGAPVFERNKAAIAASGFPAIQFLVDGANHNNFNTVWTNDDANLFGFGDPNCNVAAGPGRLSAAEQRRVGITLMGGFLRRYVGGEEQFDPVMRGEAVPAYVCPDEDPDGTGTAVGVTCRTIVRTSYVAAAAQRRVLIAPAGEGAPPASTPDGDAVSFEGFDTASACVPQPDPTGLFTAPGCGSVPNRSPVAQLTLAWSSPAKVTVALGAGRRDLSALRSLSFRAATNYTDPVNLPGVEPRVEVSLTDGTGLRRTVLSSAWSAALVPAPGSTARKQVLNGVRIPLSAFTGINLADVASIELAVGTATLLGSIQLTDLVAQEPAYAPPPAPVEPTKPKGGGKGEGGKPGGGKPGA